MLSDILTAGLVILLLVGSIVFYLYTCIQQNCQKISLLESILLDLKMSNEIKAYQDLPADHEEEHKQAEVVVPVQESYQPFEDEADEDPIDEIKSLPPSPRAEEVSLQVEEESSKEPNYDSMSLKELQALAKTRNIVGVTKKAPLIEALRTSDRIMPGSNGSAAGSSSFLENSAPVSDESA
jgi:hypothetical protein